MTAEPPIVALNPSREDGVLAPPGPCAPKITVGDLLWQVRKDVFGKEVQTTSTYSHTWLATQVGHIGLGIVIGFLLTAIRDVLGGNASLAVLFLIGSGAVSLFELTTYLWSVRRATGRFRLDDKDLRNNAIIAAAYLIIGLGFSFVFQRLSLWWNIIAESALFVLAVILAVPWLRQKIIWQKAGLPYLFRIADAKRSIRDIPAKELQEILDDGAPASQTPPRQIVIGGPIGSGRTSLAVGIGTEFAFRKTKVRYLSLNTFLECAARSSSSKFYDDTGPANIQYWRWSEAQVVIVDDIGPLLGAAQGPDQGIDLEKFQQVIERELLRAKGVLGRCHTIWVAGSLAPDGAAGTGEVLRELARIIANFCDAQRRPLVVELSEVLAPAPGDHRARDL